MTDQRSSSEAAGRDNLELALAVSAFGRHLAEAFPQGLPDDDMLRAYIEAHREAWEAEDRGRAR